MKPGLCSGMAMAILGLLALPTYSLSSPPVESVPCEVKDIHIFKAPLSQMEFLEGQKGDWGYTCTSEKLVREHSDIILAINAGPAKEDGKHQGMLKKDNEVQSPRNEYSSFLCLKPLVEGHTEGIYNDIKGHGNYKALTQNPALIKDGKNAWEGGNQKSGSVVLAMKDDDPENVYFIAATQGRKGPELADLLIDMGFDNAQFLQGGPEAQLTVAGQGKSGEEKTFQPCYESGIHPSYECGALMPVPWFIVVRSKEN